jgi:hypothetical protein
MRGSTPVSGIKIPLTLLQRRSPVPFTQLSSPGSHRPRLAVRLTAALLLWIIATRKVYHRIAVSRYTIAKRGCGVTFCNGAHRTPMAYGRTCVCALHAAHGAQWWPIAALIGRQWATIAGHAGDHRGSPLPHGASLIRHPKKYVTPWEGLPVRKGVILKK